MSKQWPYCDAPTGHPISCNMNGTPYKQAETSPGVWQWVIDTEMQKYQDDMESRRQALYWALQSRLLTAEEMEEVRQWGDHLNTPTMVSYSAEEKKRELQNALFNQARLQLIAAGKPTP